MSAPENRKNPYGLSRDHDHSEIFKLHEGVVLRPTASTSADTTPSDVSDGISCKNWSGVHVAFTFEASPLPETVASYAIVKPWRFYPTMVGDELVGTEVGRWISDYIVYVPANVPALDIPGYSQDHVWDTRDCEKMFFQVLGYYNEQDLNQYPTTFQWQAFGYTEINAAHNLSVAASSAGPGAGTGGGSTTVTEAIHDLAVKAKGPQIMTEAKDFDGLALPNTVGEGDAARLAATLAGIPYAFLTNADGSGTPIAEVSEAISAANGGDNVVMAGWQAQRITGSSFSNLAADDEAVRARASNQGIAYTTLVSENGAQSPIAQHDLPISAVNGGSVGLMNILEARNLLPTAVANADSVRAIADLYGRLMTAAFQLESQADRTEEIVPLNDKYVTEGVDVTDIDSQGTYYYPSADGATMDSKKDLSFHIALLGGFEGEVPAKIEAFLEVASGMELAAARRWEYASPAGYVSASLSAVADVDQTIRALGETSLLSASGLSYTSRVIDFDNLNVKYWRIRLVVTLADPTTTNAEYHIWPRTKAL